MASLALEADDGTTAVITGKVARSRGDIRKLSEALELSIRELGAASAITVTDDPFRLLAALDMASRSGTGLYIAHTSLTSEQIGALVEASGIRARIDDNGISATGIETPASFRPGSIHLMTSGTSGAPKIAEHSLETLLQRINAGRIRSSQAGGRWLLTFQPSGFAGLQVQLSAICSGGLVVVPAERTPAGFRDAAVSARVTHVSATPTFWRSLLMLLRPGELDLQQVTLGGEGADQVTLDRLRSLFPATRVTHTYASTEAGVVFAVHDGQAGFPAEWLEKCPQGVELRIRDGYLQIRSPALMRRYASGHDQPLQDDGWLATRDRCEIEAGRVRILGRDDAMINVAGSKVYPAAVEAVLLAMPQVSEARVYGVPNPIAGALVAADVVLKPGHDPAAAKAAISAACRVQLAGYQQPRMLRVVEQIDVMASGKKAIR